MSTPHLHTSPSADSRRDFGPEAVCIGWRQDPFSNVEGDLLPELVRGQRLVRAQTAETFLLSWPAGAVSATAEDAVTGASQIVARGAAATQAFSWEDFSSGDVELTAVFGDGSSSSERIQRKAHRYGVGFRQRGAKLEVELPLPVLHAARESGISPVRQYEKLGQGRWACRRSEVQLHDRMARIKLRRGFRGYVAVVLDTSENTKLVGCCGWAGRMVPLSPTEQAELRDLVGQLPDAYHGLPEALRAHLHAFPGRAATQLRGLYDRARVELGYGEEEASNCIVAAPDTLAVRVTFAAAGMPVDAARALVIPDGRQPILDRALDAVHSGLADRFAPLTPALRRAWFALVLRFGGDATLAAMDWKTPQAPTDATVALEHDLVQLRLACQQLERALDDASSLLVQATGLRVRIETCAGANVAGLRDELRHLASTAAASGHHATHVGAARPHLKADVARWSRATSARDRVAVAEIALINLGVTPDRALPEVHPVSPISNSELNGCVQALRDAHDELMATTGETPAPMRQAWLEEVEGSLTRLAKLLVDIAHAESVRDDWPWLASLTRLDLATNFQERATAAVALLRAVETAQDAQRTWDRFPALRDALANPGDRTLRTMMPQFESLSVACVLEGGPAMPPVPAAHAVGLDEWSRWRADLEALAKWLRLASQITRRPIHWRHA